MGRRTLLLIAAVLLAAVGTAVLFLYVQSVQGDPVAETAGGTTVLASPTRIPGGTTITDQTQFVEVVLTGAQVREGGFVTDRKQLVGRVANRDLLPYQPISADQLGGAVRGTAPLVMNPQSMAVTVEVEDPGRLGNLLGPGSRVAMWVVDPDGQRDGGHEARLVMPEVTVLTVGGVRTVNNGQGQNQGDGSSALVTLEVDQRQAATVILADAAGEIRFTLLGGDAKATAEGYTDDEVLRP